MGRTVKIDLHLVKVNVTKLLRVVSIKDGFITSFKCQLCLITVLFQILVCVWPIHVGMVPPAMRVLALITVNVRLDSTEITVSNRVRFYTNHVIFY